MKATKILHKFMVWGTWCEYIASLHMLAENEAEALEKWKAAFTESQRAGLHITVVNCTTEPWMEPHFKLAEDGSDYRHWSGRYEYSSYYDTEYSY